MRIPVGARINSALWATPVILALLVLYYRLHYSTDLSAYHGYAPTLISLALVSHYPIAYAAAAALASWESGRLKRDGVWISAPVRSRARIAASALIPVWVLAWLTLLLPAGVLLIQARVTPSLSCVPLIAMTMVVSVAYSVIGFSASLAISRFIAAPVLAAGVWYAVAASWSFSDPMWIRHVLGQYPTTLMFGELPTYISLLSHVMFVGSIAAAVGFFILLRRDWSTRLCVAVAIVLAGTVSSYTVVSSWGATPPIMEGRAPTTCVGHDPQVCMPRVTSGKAQQIETEYRSVAQAFTREGVPVDAPQKIEDSILDGRFPRSSSSHVWYLGLTAAKNMASLRFNMAQLVAVPQCRDMDLTSEQQINLWIGAVTKSQKAALQREQEEAFTETQQRDLEVSVRSVVAVEKKSVAAQDTWYAHVRKQACAKVAAVTG